MRIRGTVLIGVSVALLLLWVSRRRPEVGEAGGGAGPQFHGAVGVMPAAAEASGAHRDGDSVGTRGIHADLDQPVEIVPNSLVSALSADGPDVDVTHRVVVFGDEAAARLAAGLARGGGMEVRRVGRWVRVPDADRKALAGRWRGRVAPVSEGYDHVIGLPPQEVSREPPEGVDYLGVGDALGRVLRLPGDNSDWGSGVVVAVVDSGVAFGALPAGVRAGEADFQVGESADASHGTAVASQIVGGAQGFATAPGARVLSARVVDASGSGSAFAAAEGVLWAVAQGADVINLSLSSRGDSPVLREAIASALAAGVVVVAAAGNEGVDRVSYPASYEGVVAVGAVDALGQHLFFSNRGEVDLVAPGVGVAATGLDGKPIAVSGTSVASPQVAGAAAALLSGDPEATVEEVVAALKRAAADWGVPGEDDSYGAGLLDLGALAQQGEAGVVDVSVSPPLVWRPADSPSDVEVLAVAQNRGSAAVGVLDVWVSVGGRERESTHYNVAPGQSVSMSWRVPVGEDGPVRVEVRAAAREGDDRRPADNRWVQDVR